MQNKLTYIIDVGSSSLRLFAVTKIAGKSHILTENVVLYDGFMDGEFLTPKKLDSQFSTLISGMSSKMCKAITSVIVGVPSEFCLCVCKRITRKFTSPRKISESDMREFYQNNAQFGDSEQYTVINYSPMQCVLDDGFKTLEPVGKKSSTLVVDCSYILAKNSFIQQISKILGDLKIKHIEFVSTALGQAIACKPEKNKGNPIAIVDCGHITTSVAVYKGEGLAMLSSFSMGGGYISSDIMQLLGLSYKDAEIIKRKVVLTVETNSNESYEACYKGNLIKAPINITNQIVKSRIEMIAKVISNILNIDPVFKDVDIYLTGDGISNFRGAKNIVSEQTGHKVFDYCIPFDNTQDKFQTSKLGLKTLAEILE